MSSRRTQGAWSDAVDREWAAELAVRLVNVFPMTAHVECVALLVKA